YRDWSSDVCSSDLATSTARTWILAATPSSPDSASCLDRKRRGCPLLPAGCLATNSRRRERRACNKRTERQDPRGGLGCVASTGLRKVRFRICGNDWTYGRILGCVAGKGVRG